MSHICHFINQNYYSTKITQYWSIFSENLHSMSSEYSFCSEGGFDELSSSSDSGFDVSFESPKHEVQSDTLFPPAKEGKRKKTRNTRCKSPTQVSGCVYLRSAQLPLSKGTFTYRKEIEQREFFKKPEDKKRRLNDHKEPLICRCSGWKGTVE